MNPLWTKIKIFLEMIKFSHTVFALPFALLTLLLAIKREETFRPMDLLGVLVCMVSARTAAMGFNRWVDAALDAQNPRTKIRAIPAGLLTKRQVALYVLISSAVFFAGTAIFYASSGNTWPMLLSPIVLLFLFGYSFAKRFTSFAHVWLGVALALAPPCTWLAVRGNLELAPLLLSLVILCWVTGFDIIYACQDIDVDRTLGLRSIPAWLGHDGAMNVARFSHFLMVVALGCFTWLTPELGMFMKLSWILVTILLLAEHLLVRRRDLSRINLAFLYVNGTISLGLLIATILDLFVPMKI